MAPLTATATNLVGRIAVENRFSYRFRKNRKSFTNIPFRRKGVQGQIFYQYIRHVSMTSGLTILSNSLHLLPLVGSECGAKRIISISSETLSFRVTHVAPLAQPSSRSTQKLCVQSSPRLLRTVHISNRRLS